MRLFSNGCAHKKCSNPTRAGFRFCYKKDCVGRSRAFKGYTEKLQEEEE